jgi:hypothetical protein
VGRKKSSGVVARVWLSSEMRGAGVLFAKNGFAYDTRLG